MIPLLSLRRGKSQNSSTALIPTPSVASVAQGKVALEEILVVEQIVYRASF